MSRTPRGNGRFSRRTLLKAGALAAAAPALAMGGTAMAAGNGNQGPDNAPGSLGPHRELIEVTIVQLQQMMTTGHLTSAQLVQMYLDRIAALDQRGPHINSVLQLNPDALAIARALDKERKAGHVRGPLHGIPILLKDNIDTGDKMDTTAGSLALLGSKPTADAPVAAQLRAAGAVLMGKTTLSEWANYRSTHSSSGWSGRGGQCNNPYELDRNPCGSSSGSGASVSANLIAASIGTETDGSIVCPANNNGVVGIKPTVGLVSRFGVIPISHNQDTVGPHGRVVADAAAVLSAITAPDTNDVYTTVGNQYNNRPQSSVGLDYTAFLDAGALKGKKIGVARKDVTGYSEKTDAIYERAIQAIKDAGAIVTDPADPPPMPSGTENTVLSFDFKHDINAYLAMRNDPNIHTLQDLIDFNNSHAYAEMRYFGQEIFIASEATTNLSDPTYTAALTADQDYAKAFAAFLSNYDAVIAPTGSPAWTTDLIDGDHFEGASSSYAAISGFPLVSVPMGSTTMGTYPSDFGLPVGLTFMGPAWSEKTLIALAYAFEQATHFRTPPTYRMTTP
ncbi:MAG TPA: amidase [Thermomicrobiaceae bacterium]|nr:amidase [Thermomicrobiaceae bacterium]